MQINRKKFELAKARACISSNEIYASGISKGTYCRAIGEGKTVRPETAGKLAKILGVDVTEIIED